MPDGAFESRIWYTGRLYGGVITVVLPADNRVIAANDKGLHELKNGKWRPISGPWARTIRDLAIAAFAAPGDLAGDPSTPLFADGRFKAPTLRKLTIYGYYTSLIGASEELDLNLVPGSYDACAAIGAADHAPSLYAWGITLDLRPRPIA